MPQPSPKRTPWLHRDRGAGEPCSRIQPCFQAGYPAQWIQYPYLVGGRKGRLTVVAKVHVDPKRTKAPQRPASRLHALTLRVAVAAGNTAQVRSHDRSGCCQTQHC